MPPQPSKWGGANRNFKNGNGAAFDAEAYSAAGNGSYDISGNLWAPDVIWNPTMNKWCMYLSINGDNANCSIVLLTSDNIEGPYLYQGPVVFSGFNIGSSQTYKYTDLEIALGTQASLPSRYAVGSLSGWRQRWPNAIDPCVFYDETGKLWMSYGSWHGGIWMLELDEKTGLRDYDVTYTYTEGSSANDVRQDPYFGKKIAGGRHVSGEASYIKYIDGYYYLFVTYGELTANGGYQMRVFRSTTPDGSYADPYHSPGVAIYDQARVNYGPDGTRKTDRGENIFGAYGDWGYMATGDDSERSQGHNSVVTNGDQTFMVYHTRFQNRDNAEAHELRVHQLFKNSDGWLCAAPFEYTGETVTNTNIKNTQQIATADIPGNYKVLLHTLNLDHANKQLTEPVDIELKSDGSITGDMTGSWSITEGTSYISITVGGKTYKGVMIEQTMEPMTQKVAAFTAMTTSDGNTLWGYKVPEASTIGALDKGWADAGSYTPAYTIPSNKTLTLTFQLTNYSGDWGGYILSLAKNTVSVPQFGGDNGYVWFRSPDFAWYKTNWNTGAVVSNTNTKGTMTQSDWQAFVKDATTVMAIQRYGTQVFIKTTVTKGDDSYTHYFVTEIGTTKDVKAFLCADAATITISDFAITDTENVDPETATIGADGNDGAFGASPVTTLEPESVLTMHFTNHSAKADSYDNYGIELAYNGNYANIVLGGGRWGTLLENAPVTNKEETYNEFADFLNKMDGADVTLTIARSGRVVTITAVHVPADNSTPFTLKYTLEPNATAFPDFATGNISVNLTTDHSHITYKFIPKITATISEYGWSTFCSSSPLDFTSVDGLTAYAVTGHDGANITKVEVASAVPAGTPLLLKGDANTTYFIPVAASGTAPAVNLLKAGTGASVAPESGKTKYALSVEGGAAHFKKITSARAIPVGKAYLVFDEAIAARELGFDGFDGGDATGINMVNGEGLKVNGSEVYYDLQGRRVLYPKKGLYIVNGKKVVIK